MLSPMLLEKLLLSVLFLISISSFGQLKNNRHDRLTKVEFSELLTDRHYFIPSDLKDDTVVIVRYSPDKLSWLMNHARNVSFAKNGTDTTGLRNDTWLTPKQMERNKKRLSKFSLEYPQELKNALSKKGISGIIVDEQDLDSSLTSGNPIWLMTTYVSTQKSLDDNGWVLSTTNRFYDSRSKKHYEVFLPLSHSLFDMIE